MENYVHRANYVATYNLSNLSEVHIEIKSSKTVKNIR